MPAFWGSLTTLLTARDHSDLIQTAAKLPSAQLNAVVKPLSTTTSQLASLPDAQTGTAEQSAVVLAGLSASGQRVGRRRPVIIGQ